ncbi:MAG TPA: ImmA/IrrE family metallo-endopeptidase [Armatimonadota bacterium]|jgi:hypothetical protein
MTSHTTNLQIDGFLHRWAFVSYANIEHFAGRSAQWMRLQPPPRFAAGALPDWGVGIRRDALPGGVDAVWSLDDGAYVIRVSPFLAPARANFTLWHEWFEVMASRPAFPGRYTPHRLERLADLYAAAITMPADTVARSLKEFRDSGDKADVMAARFGISVAAMRRRIRELAPDRRIRPAGWDSIR